MLKQLRAAATILLTLGLLSGAPVAQADWISDWQGKLSELWQDTKAKTTEVTAAVKEKLKDVEIGIAYGTEKREWLEWAVEAFKKTEDGKKIQIELIPMGSVEGAEAILKQDDAAKKIHVWTPASSLVRNLLADKWPDGDPILSDAMLALTPMVIVMWEDRYKAFVAKYNEVNFTTIAQALSEQTGWAAIANKPEWGVFTFEHTTPTHSNSGLLALVLMAYDYTNLFRDIKPSQIMDAGFLSWLKAAQRNMSTDETSTGKLMKTMIQRGPSEINAIIVYENLALSNLEAAKKRWGALKVIYPTRSVWNDNPYYILDVPWSTEEQRVAAQLFQDFLLSKKAQKVARDQYLFRPASVDLPILDESSVFSELESIVQLDVATIQKPSAEVLNQLLQVWKRN
jgi:ABC-type Fe3+ transport system substrate-binding protein